MTGPAVLTTASSVTCADSGTVAPTSTRRLRVGGKPVLLAPGAGESISISACPVTDDASHSILKCTSVSSLTAGNSSRLTVGGTSVLLDVLAGFSNGTPPPTGKPLPPAAANQTRLRAAAVV